MSGTNWTEVPASMDMFESANSTPDTRLPASWVAYFNIPEWLIKTTVVISFAIGSAANLFILVYFFKSGKYHIPLFTLFFGLALCDLVMCLCVCAIAQAVYPEVLFQFATKELSVMVNYLASVAYGASVLHLVYLAALRFYQLCYPLKAQIYVTPTWVMKWCFAIWALSFISNIPMPMYRDVRTMPYEGRTVKLFVFTGNFNMKNVLDSTFLQVIPFVVVATLHLLKLYKMAVQSDLENKGGRSVSSRMAALIIIVFILSIAVRLGHSFCHGVLGFPNRDFHKLLSISASRLSQSNSIVNPFIYFLGSGDMRKAIWKTFTRCDKVKN